MFFFEQSFFLFLPLFFPGSSLRVSLCIHRSHFGDHFFGKKTHMLHVSGVEKISTSNLDGAGFDFRGLGRMMNWII